MSMEAITKVFKNSKTDGNALLILLSLADWCDQDFSCFPSIKRIAEKARVSEPTAKRYMRAFMKMGLITKEAREDKSGRQTSNRYYLNVEMIGADEVTKEILDSVTYDSQRQDWEGVRRVSGLEGVNGLTGGGSKSIYREEGVSAKKEPSSDSAIAPSNSSIENEELFTMKVAESPSAPKPRKAKPVDDSFIAELKKLNPTKDVDAEVIAAKNWLLAHPPRQFTKSFFSSWINRTKPTIDPEGSWKPTTI